MKFKGLRGWLALRSGALLCFCLLLSLQQSVAQNQSDSEILVRLLDNETKIPLVFASVVLKKNKTGLVSDNNGFFRLPLRYKAQQEILQISSIGYSSKEVSVADLKNGTINLIYIEPRTEQLSGVILSANEKTRPEAQLKPESIVKRAIQKISSNYPTDPYSYVAYYRDYQLFENDYINLNEALVEVFDSGYNSDKITDSYNQTALFKYVENNSFSRDTLWASLYETSGQKFIKDARMSALGGNELAILNLHNPIRNRSRNSFSFVHVFKKDFLEYHLFKLEGIRFRDETPIYHISFKTRADIIKSRYAAEGSIYIGKDNFGIYKFSYKGFEKHAYDPLYSLDLEYLPYGEKMVLSYISFNNNFQIKSKENFKISAILLDKDQNAFFITFNNPVKEASISDLGNYKFIYKKRKLRISKVQLINPKTVKVALVSGSLPGIESLNETIMGNIEYKVKNIEDQLGRKLNKLSLININQFREMFVQKVNFGKALPLNGKFIDKNSPLSENKVIPFKDIDDYWINSPLKLTN